MAAIAVFIPGVVKDDYLGVVYAGIADAAQKHRYSLLTSIQNNHHQNDVTHFMRPGGCDGVVMVVPENYEYLVDLCREYRRECVLIDYPREQDARDLPTVEANNYEGMSLVMRHLLTLGHKRVGFITGRLTVAAGRQRFQAYRDALQAAGIVFDPALVGSGEWLQAPAYRAARRLLGLEAPPTAIVASDDLMALGAFQAARELGLEIGKQVSISGFDDVKTVASMTPPLTTVRQPMYELGRVAVEMLVKRINGEPLDDMHVCLDTQLIVRQSTGPAPR